MEGNYEEKMFDLKERGEKKVLPKRRGVSMSRPHCQTAYRTKTLGRKRQAWQVYGHYRMQEPYYISQVLVDSLTEKYNRCQCPSGDKTDSSYRRSLHAKAKSTPLYGTEIRCAFAIYTSRTSRHLQSHK